MNSRRRVNSTVMWLRFSNWLLKPMRRLIVVALFLILSLSAYSQTTRRTSRPRSTTPSRATELTPRQIAALIFPSTVSIYVLGDDGDVYSGAGFIVSPGVVATCYHVIEDARRIIVTPMNESDDRHVASLVRYDRERDTALLRVNGLKGKPVTLSHQSDFYIGEAIYTLGNPKGLEGTFSNGIMSNFIRVDDTWYMQFTAPVSPGSSGGPVVNNKGQVVAMVNMQFREGQNLNFAIFGIHIDLLVQGKHDLPPGTYADNDLGPPPRKKP
jgi:S1-C subfamily serine protease